VGTLPDRSTLYLPYEQIIYAQSKGRHTLVHCENGTICELLSPLRDIARDNPALLRVHASYLVNPRYVTRIARFQLTLADGTTIPVPERRYTAIKSLLSNLGTVPELLKRLRLEQ
jgi:DNA-binding LytR/AlgR family response regulator